jgi:hypothetical protein
MSTSKVDLVATRRVFLTRLPNPKSPKKMLPARSIKKGAPYDPDAPDALTPERLAALRGTSLVTVAEYDLAQLGIDTRLKSGLVAATPRAIAEANEGRLVGPGALAEASRVGAARAAKKAR